MRLIVNIHPQGLWLAHIEFIISYRRAICLFPGTLKLLRQWGRNTKTMRPWFMPELPAKQVQAVCLVAMGFHLMGVPNQIDHVGWREIGITLLIAQVEETFIAWQDLSGKQKHFVPIVPLKTS